MPNRCAPRAQSIASSLPSAAVCLLALTTAVAAQVSITPEMYPTGWDGRAYTNDQSWLVTRIVDGITGAPIPTAELLLVAESPTPIRGEFWFSMRATADADGFVRLRCDKHAPNYEPWGWTIIRAPGYAATVSMGSVGRGITALAPAIPFPVRIIDWHHEPVADVLVGFCGGCGHTPDLAWGRTDATGLVTLTGVDPHDGIGDIYLEHPALALGYFDDATWHPGEAPLTFRTPPGKPAIGRVADAAGAAVRDAYVGCDSGYHRGPWTRTGSDGSFALFGPEVADDLVVVHGQQRVWFERPAAEPFVLRLPKPSDDREQFVARPQPPRETPLPGAPTEALPEVLVRVASDPPAEVTLWSSGGVRNISEEVRLGRPIALPAGSLTFELGDPGQPFRFSQAEAVAAAPIRLHPFPPSRVEGQVVDTEGEPVTSKVGLRSWRGHHDCMHPENEEFDAELQTDGAFSLPTTMEGLSILVVRPLVGSEWPRLLPVILPPRGADIAVDVGTIRLGTKPNVSVTFADGKPCAWLEAALLRPGWQNVRETPDTVPLDDLGSWLGIDARSGDTLVVYPPESDDLTARHLTQRFPLQGDGPWQLRIPSGRIRLAATDDAGAPIESAKVIIGDQVFDLAEDDMTTFHGLRLGAQRLFVTANGRKTAIVDVVIRANEVSEQTIVLPPR